MKRSKSFPASPYVINVVKEFSNISKHEFFQDVRIYCTDRQVYKTSLLPLVINSLWLKNLLKDREVHTIVEIIVPDFGINEVEAFFDLVLLGRSKDLPPYNEIVTKILSVAKAFGINASQNQLLQLKNDVNHRGDSLLKSPSLDVKKFLDLAPDKFFVCRLCRRTFHDFNVFQHHLSFDHNQSPRIGINCSIFGKSKVTEPSDEESQEKCIFCLKVFPSKDDLLRHVRQSYYKRKFRKLFGWSRVNFCIICSRKLGSIEARCHHEHHILDLIHLKTHVQRTQSISDKLIPSKRGRFLETKSKNQVAKIVSFDANLKESNNENVQKVTEKIQPRGIMKNSSSNQCLPTFLATVQAHTIFNGMTRFFMPDAIDLNEEQRSDFDRKVVRRFMETVNRAWGFPS